MNLLQAYEKALDAIKFIILNPLPSFKQGPESQSLNNSGAQNDIKYLRYQVSMHNYRTFNLSYLLTSGDTHNTTTLKVYGTMLKSPTLPDEDTAIEDSDEIFNISDIVLGDAAGISASNTTVGAIKMTSQQLRCENIIIELKFEEDNTGTPVNSSELHWNQSY